MKPLSRPFRHYDLDMTAHRVVNDVAVEWPRHVVHNQIKEPCLVHVHTRTRWLFYTVNRPATVPVGHAAHSVSEASEHLP